MDLALSHQQKLIWHKTQTTHQILSWCNFKKDNSIPVILLWSQSLISHSFDIIRRTSKGKPEYFLLPNCWYYKWTWRPGFQSWIKLFAFHSAVIILSYLTLWWLPVCRGPSAKGLSASWVKFIALCLRCHKRECRRDQAFLDGHA